MKPLLVGELNPYGSAPEFALYPLPEHASGGRLARILGLSRGEYLRRFDRVNLCEGKWRMSPAREHALTLLRRGGPLVLLGAKVCKGFNLPYEPFTCRDAEGGKNVLYGLDSTVPAVPIYILPHPSGLNRIWNAHGSSERARELLKPLLLQSVE